MISCTLCSSKGNSCLVSGGSPQLELWNYWSLLRENSYVPPWTFIRRLGRYCSFGTHIARFGKWVVGIIVVMLWWVEVDQEVVLFYACQIASSRWELGFREAGKHSRGENIWYQHDHNYKNMNCQTNIGTWEISVTQDWKLNWQLACSALTIDNLYSTVLGPFWYLHHHDHWIWYLSLTSQFVSLVVSQANRQTGSCILETETDG